MSDRDIGREGWRGPICSPCGTGQHHRCVRDCEPCNCRAVDTDCEGRADFPARPSSPPAPPTAQPCGPCSDGGLGHLRCIGVACPCPHDHCAARKTGDVCPWCVIGYHERCEGVSCGCTSPDCGPQEMPDREGTAGTCLHPRVVGYGRPVDGMRYQRFNFCLDCKREVGQPTTDQLGTTGDICATCLLPHRPGCLNALRPLDRSPVDVYVVRGGAYSAEEWRERHDALRRTLPSGSLVILMPEGVTVEAMPEDFARDLLAQLARKVTGGDRVAFELHDAHAWLDKCEVPTTAGGATLDVLTRIGLLLHRLKVLADKQTAALAFYADPKNYVRPNLRPAAAGYEPGASPADADRGAKAREALR